MIVLMISKEERRVANKIMKSHGFPLLTRNEMIVAKELARRAEAYFWQKFPEARDDDFPLEGFTPWFVDKCTSNGH